MEENEDGILRQRDWCGGFRIQNVASVDGFKGLRVCTSVRLARVHVWLRDGTTVRASVDGFRIQNVT